MSVPPQPPRHEPAAGCRCVSPLREMRGGLARVLCVHRLHRARLHGDRRRRLAGGEPGRRTGARKAGSSSAAICRSRWSSGRSRRTSAPSCRRHGKVSSAATMRAMARTRRRQGDAGRDEGRGRRLSAIRPSRARSARSARRRAGAARRRFRRASPIRRCWRGSASSRARGSPSATPPSRSAPR